jgi:aryl-alcohol dehydrogenase-like predicted oxidoreductase
MVTHLLGGTDLPFSTLGLGCNNFGAGLDLAAATGVVNAAIDTGITMFDTADVYGKRGGSETILGQALGRRRKDVVLATKFGVAMDDEGRFKGGSYGYVMSAVEASLKRLKTDWIDLYYYHRPDPATPFEETIRALNQLIRQGKVRYIGCSNMSAGQIAEAQTTAETHGFHRFVCCQDQYSLLARQIENELIPELDKQRIPLLPYFPLASGMLTGKYQFGASIPKGTRLSQKRYSDRFLNDRNLAVVEDLKKFCAERGRSMLELAFGWLLTNPVVGCVIAGASTPEQVLQNQAATGWRLGSADVAEVNRITSQPNG